MARPLSLVGLLWQGVCSGCTVYSSNDRSRSFSGNPGTVLYQSFQDLVNFDRVEHDNFFIAVHNPVVLFKFFLWLLTMVVLLSI